MAILHGNPRPTGAPTTDADVAPSPPPSPQPQYPPRRFSYRAAYISMGVIGAALVFLLIRFTVDDAFITWRYGQSLMSGFWNWNPAPSDKVEAYSNTLFAVLAATTAFVVFTVYRISNLGMDFGNRFRWQLLFPIAVVLLCRPLPLRSTASSPDAPSPRWAALAVFLGALAAWAWGRPAAIVAGAIGLMVAASAVTSGELLGWTVYRYHIQDAHQAIGRAIAADPSMRGTVAIGDSGVPPYSLSPDQSALDIGGLADPFAGKPALPPAVLGDLVAVVALGGSNQPYDVWPGDSSAAQVYDYMVARHFHFVPGVPYAPGYWLNLYLRPGHGGRLVADLDAIRAAATAQNLLPDDQVLSGHLFDFPFLRG